MATTKKYAEGTEVSVAKSREEIERLLNRYGAHGFMYGTQGEVAAVMFEIKGRQYRIEIHYPNESKFMSPQRRTQASLQNAREAEIKRLWRALTMVIKAKLEAVKSGIRTVEQEFHYDTVMSNNQTVGEWLKPQLEEMYQSGEMPPLIPGVNTTQKQIGRTKNSDAIDAEFKESRG